MDIEGLANNEMTEYMFQLDELPVDELSPFSCPETPEDISFQD